MFWKDLLEHGRHDIEARVHIDVVRADGVYMIERQICVDCFERTQDVVECPVNLFLEIGSDVAGLIPPALP